MSDLTTVPAVSPTPPRSSHFDFRKMLDVQQQSVDLLCKTDQSKNPAKFKDGKLRLAHSVIDGDELYELYLNSFETPELRQHHSCSCCRQFMRNYGNLVFLMPDGETASPFFSIEDDTFPEVRAFVQAAWDKLKNSPIEKMFFAKDTKSFGLGTFEAGGFNHFHYKLENILPRPNAVLTSDQNASVVNEDIRLLVSSFDKWSDETLKRACELFTHHETLSRTQFSEIVSDFLDIRTRYRYFRNNVLRKNFLFGIATTSRKGVLRIGQTVVGEFLDDLQVGDSDKAIRAFLLRADAANYQRPTAAPSSATVKRAEFLFAELNLADSLKRRALRRDEVTESLWRKQSVEDTVEGIFSKVKTREGESASQNKESIDGGRISLRKLLSLISNASKIEIKVPGTSTCFSSMATATVPDAAPILIWDDMEKRNPVSTYRYSQPVHSSTWGLDPLSWEEIALVTRNPAKWNRPQDPDDSIFFILVNGHDKGNASSLPLFPETLRSELHEVRSVIEAYCQTERLTGLEQGLVAWNFVDGQPTVFRVTYPDSVVIYTVNARD